MAEPLQEEERLALDVDDGVAIGASPGSGVNLGVGEGESGRRKEDVVTGSVRFRTEGPAANATRRTAVREDVVGGDKLDSELIGLFHGGPLY
jgi:hypothetical protein